MDYPFRLPFGHPFRNAFSLPGFGRALPPASDDLLVLLKGLNTADDTAKLDSWAKPDQENMVLTQSACIGFDGVAEKGTTSSDLGTIVSSGGTAELSYDGTDITATAGTCWRIEFSNGAIFPIAEVNGLTSWDTTGTHSITWTPGAGGIAGMRAARQDSYHYNANFGWWGSEGSEIKYPYNPANDYSKLLATSSTIVDVFIYDTSKDSDGGAWRGSTIGASWYNETLGTATRGGTREFPAVAFIVAETTKVTIFDATDPLMPMWMVFNSGTYCYIRTTAITSISMKNGEMIIGNNNTAYGMAWVSFTRDKSVGSIINTVTGYSITLPLSGRNNTSSSYRVQNVPYIIVNSVVNDVAMTVLPDAPIDPETGIAVPTIAVATNGGVSVIDGPAGVGTVVDSSMTGASGQVYFDNVGGLWYGRTDQTRLYSSDDYSSDIFLYQTYRENKVPATLLQVPVAMDINVSGGASGLTLLKENTVLPSAGMVCYLTDSYISGWMQGDIELCLSGENLTDKSVNGITVTDNGSATFATVNTETDLQATTATGGTITATVPTGRVCYGWELVSGSWVFNKTIGDFVGVSEAGGTLTIADGTTFTLLKYTSGTPSDDQFTDIYTTEKELFKDGAKCTLTSSNVTSLSYDESESALFVGTPSNITRVDGLVTTIERTPFNTKAIDFKGGENVSASTTEAASGYTIETIKYPAGTMNYPESLMAFEEKPVGSPNGTTDAFVMLADHGTIVSSAGTSAPTYVHPDISLTAGWIRNILFSDGTLLRVDEGTGADLYDTDGVLSATLTTGDSVAFRTDAAPMVSQAVMDMEAAMRGPELVVNGGFDTDTVWLKGVGWSIADGIASAAGAAAYQSLYQLITELVAGTYIVKFDAVVTAGNISCYLGGRSVATNFSSGSYEIEVTTSLVNKNLTFEPLSTFSGYVDNISVSEVTAKRFFTDGLGHSLPMHQSAMDELGVELVDIATLVYTDWTHDAGVFTCVGPLKRINTPAGSIVVGKTYEINISIDVLPGLAYIYIGSVIEVTSIGTIDLQVVATRNNFIIDAPGVGTVVSSISIREVNPVINANDQYFRKNCVGKPLEYLLYKTVQTGDDLTAIEDYCCIGA